MAADRPAGPTLAARVDSSPGLRRRQRIGRALTAVLADLDVTGLRHVPLTGPVVLAVNHTAFLDGPLLFGLLDRPVSFLVKSEAFAPPLVGRVLRGAGQIPVHRDTVDPAPVRLALAILRRGGVVGIFPEGTRGHGRVETAKPGAAYLALRTGATVVPVACHGTLDMTHGRRWHRPPVRVTFGPPVPVTPWPRTMGARTTGASTTGGSRQPLPRRVFRAEGERVRAVLADLVAHTDPSRDPTPEATP
ncbi:lysophospholipid acyltransferase family protein [Jatrophihabitans sp. YIM 134969]